MIALALGLVFMASITCLWVVRWRNVPPPANALRIQVYGHQWWWEFRYGEYHVVSANELYLPSGRPVAFSLQSTDALRAFSIPQLPGYHDLVTNAPHALWFTPEATTSTAVWTGVCTSACGLGRPTPRFLIFTVSPKDFARWVAAQHAFGASILSSAAPPDGYSFPHDRIPTAVLPHTPIPPRLKDSPQLRGIPGRGEMLFAGAGTCVTCHTVRASPLAPDLGYPPTCMPCHIAAENPMATGIPAPDLTHIASRVTIAGGRYLNDAVHLTRWIRNARLMKPGVIMPTLGTGQYDPWRHSRIRAGLNDQQIADLVAYLQVLK